MDLLKTAGDVMNRIRLGQNGHGIYRGGMFNLSAISKLSEGQIFTKGQIVAIFQGRPAEENEDDDGSITYFVNSTEYKFRVVGQSKFNGLTLYKLYITQY